MLRDYFPRGLSWITLVSLCFGSFVVWYLTVENSMVHGVSMFATTLFLFVWHRARRDPRAADWARVGVAAGLMTMVRWQNGLFLLLPALQMAHRVWTDTAGDAVARGMTLVKRGGVLAVAGGLTFVPQMGFWKLVYGEWWHLPSNEHGGPVAGAACRRRAVLVEPWPPVADTGGLSPDCRGVRERPCSPPRT